MMGWNHYLKLEHLLLVARILKSWKTVNVYRKHQKPFTGVSHCNFTIWLLQPSGSEWTTLHFIPELQNGIILHMYTVFSTHRWFKNPLCYPYMTIGGFENMYKDKHTHLEMAAENTSGFIFSCVTSISFCSQRWLSRILSCNILAFCSRESCLCVSFRSSKTWKYISLCFITHTCGRKKPKTLRGKKKFKVLY